MKKVLFTALIALLALFVAGCDNDKHGTNGSEVVVGGADTSSRGNNAVVPEPATLLTFLIGAGGVALANRKARKNA